MLDSFRNENSSILCSNGTFENRTYETNATLTSTHSPNLFPNSLVIIFVLSILSLFGVCFMIFGPLQRSEAYKRVENFTFGRNPLFNDEQQGTSNSTRFDESMEFVDE